MATVQNIQKVTIKIPKAEAEKSARDLKRLDQAIARFSRDADWMHMSLKEEETELGRKDA